MSLVSQNDQAEILCKHFADSLALAEVCSTGARVVDLGSGAGFPGLPLAVARPDIDLWLVESSAKKTSFLLHVISLAEVRNAHVANTRIEALVSDPRHSGRYSLAVARAFGELVEFLRSALPLLSESGRAVAMKGPRYRAELDNADVPDIGFLPPQVTEYQLPDGSERRLLCFERRP
jgi:16S rRNA (guanine527-N7)-methyltransferase